MIEIIGKKTRAQLHSIAVTYKSMYGTEFAQDVKNVCVSHYKDLIIGLSMLVYI